MPHMTVMEVAKIAHEANRAYCQILGDHSQKPWDEAPDWQRHSAVDGVMFVLNTPTATVSASHENWLATKKKEGWRYGPVKDEERKEHPSFLPYDQLPLKQQLKNHLFRCIVLVYKPFLGMSLDL